MKRLTTLLLLLLSMALSAEKLTYDIIVLGKKIGTVKIEKIITPGAVQYKLLSTTFSNFFFVTRRSYQSYIVNYKGGQLVKVDAINAVNQDSTKVKIDWNGTHYTVVKNRKSFEINEPVRISTLALYFQKPKTDTRVFSERLGEFYSVKEAADGSIEYTLSDGMKSVFYYSNGIPQKIEMKKSIITIEMVLVKND